MDTLPARIIIQVFTKEALTEKELTKLRGQIAEGLESQGRRLVDLIVDQGPAKLDPAEHESLIRIASGDADGIGLVTFPLSMSPKKSVDVLGSHMTGPFLFLNAAELADRGLLPGGTLYQPERKKADVADHAAGTPRPIWEAAARAAQLREQHLSLRQIGAMLEKEDLLPPRGGRWHVGSVAQLLKRNEPEGAHAHEDDGQRVPEGH